MPESIISQASDPGKQLRGGEFYSPVQSRLRTGDVLLSELRQPCPRHVPRHEHELAYVTLMLGGDYMEGDRGHLSTLQPFNAVFNPAGIAHSTIIGPTGAAFFTVELQDQCLRQLGVCLPDHTTVDRGTGPMLWPAIRLYFAFKTGTADPLVLEAHVFEMLGAITGYDAAGRNVPGWFGRVKERLHEGFRDGLRMRDLAAEAGVHPVHLARVFRKFEKRTPGEYQQSLQVRAACQLLRDRDWTLAGIAAECGFSDQSHLTRIFRRMTGTTPARFRLASTFSAA